MNHRNLQTLAALTTPVLGAALTASRDQTLATLDVKNGDAVRQWIDIKRSYEQLRGTRPGLNRKSVPKTTVADVKAIATQWSGELKKVKARNPLDRAEHERWLACLKRIDTLSKGRGPSAPYPAEDNETFWQLCTRRLAIYLESRKVVPSRWDLAVSALTETVAGVPSAVSGAANEAAGFVAGVVQEPAKLAAVVLGGAILVPPIVRAFRKD